MTSKVFVTICFILGETELTAALVSAEISAKRNVRKLVDNPKAITQCSAE